jgi:hypothetical protein
MPPRVVVLNEFSQLQSRGGLRNGQFGPQKLGSTYMTIRIDASPVTLRDDPKALGKGPAEAIAKHLRARIDGITERAAPSTLARRERAAREAYRPATSGQDANMLRRRYQPTKHSATPPNSHQTLFKDSGRFVAGLVAAAVGQSYVINVARTRLDPTTFGGGESALAKMFLLLQSHVPEIANPAMIRDVISVRSAIKKATPLIDPRIAKQAIKSAGKFLNQDVSIRDIVDGARRIYTVAV